MLSVHCSVFKHEVLMRKDGNALNSKSRIQTSHSTCFAPTTVPPTNVTSNLPILLLFLNTNAVVSMNPASDLAMNCRLAIAASDISFYVAYWRMPCFGIQGIVVNSIDTLSKVKAQPWGTMASVFST